MSEIERADQQIFIKRIQQDEYRLEVEGEIERSEGEKVSKRQ